MCMCIRNASKDRQGCLQDSCLHLFYINSFHLIVPTYESIKLLGTSESYMKSGKS